MAITSYSITSAKWLPITSAGESGTCWLQSLPDLEQVVINHSDSGVPTDAEVENSYVMKKDLQNIVPISADNSNDIFYVRLTGETDTAKVIADVS